MSGVRVHRTVSLDGTRIVARVHGHGPPLVLVHGAPHDGDVAWAALVPCLAERFHASGPRCRAWATGARCSSPSPSPPSS